MKRLAPPSPNAVSKSKHPRTEQPSSIENNATTPQAPYPAISSRVDLAEDRTGVIPPNVTGFKPRSPDGAPQFPGDGLVIPASVLSSQNTPNVHAANVTGLPYSITADSSDTLNFGNTEATMNWHLGQQKEISGAYGSSVSASVSAQGLDLLEGSPTSNADSAAGPASIIIQPEEISDTLKKGLTTDLDEDQDMEGTLTLLRDLVDSIRREVDVDCLQTAISLLQGVLGDGTYSGRDCARVKYYLIKALLTRHGICNWIEDLDECIQFTIAGTTKHLIAAGISAAEEER